MSARLDLPDAILSRLRGICSALPESREAAAWVGVRWRVRRATFAHVLMLEDGWPPAYAAAAGIAGPACLLTFRTVDRLFQPDRFDHAPFFRPPWFANIMGLVVRPSVDWEDVRELIHDSYRVMAPRSLARGLDAVGPAASPSIDETSMG